jgi:predicted MFS family arabinose efflux permease
MIARVVHTDTVPVIGHRGVRGAMYGCIAAAGVTLWFVPIPFLVDLVGVTYLVISLFLLVGGTVSGIGHFLRSIIIERAGYPLFLTALAVLTAMLLKGSDDQAARVFIAFITFSFTLGLYGRWRDLKALREQLLHGGEHGGG